MASPRDSGAAEAGAGEAGSPAGQTAVAPPVAIDTDSYAGDSAYDSELNSFTTSLSSSVSDYKQEHGRRYHAFKEGKYQFPNDEKEMDRLDVAHEMIKTAMDGKLHAAPIKDPKRILDVGTGTGIWAIEMGDKFEQCEIIGTDLSPIQPRWVPPNVHFEVDDAEAVWTYEGKFDLVHCRCLYAAIRDWPGLVKQAFDGLRPGGYCEFTDVDLLWRSPDQSIGGSAGEKVNGIFINTCNAGGLDPNPGRSLEKWVSEAGFEDVHAKTMIMPFGTWPADKKLKEVGAWNFLQTMEGMESFFMAVFTRMLGYAKEEVDVLCAQVRSNLKDPKYHAYFTLVSVYGRKPERAGTGPTVDETAAATKTTTGDSA